MSLLSVLRRWGIIPCKKVTDEDVARATTENALIDNDRAFQTMHETYSKVPEANKKLRETIKKSKEPLADLEILMHGDYVDKKLRVGR